MAFTRGLVDGPVDQDNYQMTRLAKESRLLTPQVLS